jgi:hypothetical protein
MNSMMDLLISNSSNSTSDGGTFIIAFLTITVIILGYFWFLSKEMSEPYRHRDYKNYGSDWETEKDWYGSKRTQHGAPTNTNTATHTPHTTITKPRNRSTYSHSAISAYTPRSTHVAPPSSNKQNGDPKI